MINNDIQEIGKNIININIIVFFLSLSFFMSQFYVWDSGTPQPSHIFVVFFILSFVLKRSVLDISSIKILLLFTIYVIINNIVWFFINDFSQSYLDSIMYWVFNFSFYLFLINLGGNKDIFFKAVLNIIFFSYLLIFFLWFIGFGRYDYYPRFNGFFNDPNQMAFWILSTCSIYLCISKKNYSNIAVYLLTVFLILLTLSRSALLGIPFLTLALITKQKGSLSKKIALTAISFFTLLVIFYMTYKEGFFDNIILRFFEGVEEKDKQIGDRGFDLLLEFPEHLLFGAGQGGYDIYSSTGHEIHSTWLGILFYYGIFGLLLFLFFLYNIFKRLTFSEKMLFIAPMVYGFTTYSVRNTIFWFFIGIFFLAKKNR